MQSVKHKGTTHAQIIRFIQLSDTTIIALPDKKPPGTLSLTSFTTMSAAGFNSEDTESSLNPTTQA
jgi:hypothetical protein